MDIRNLGFDSLRCSLEHEVGQLEEATVCSTWNGVLLIILNVFKCQEASYKACRIKTAHSFYSFVAHTISYPPSLKSHSMSSMYGQMGRDRELNDTDVSRDALIIRITQTLVIKPSSHSQSFQTPMVPSPWSWSSWAAQLLRMAECNRPPGGGSRGPSLPSL